MARESSVTNGSAAPERKRSTRPWRSCSTKRKTTRRSRHGDGGGLTPETQQQATVPAPHPGHKKFSSRPVAPTIFLEKPFDENVEELSHCGDEVCVFEAAVQKDDFEDSTLCSLARSAIEEPPWTNHAVTRSCPAPGASGSVPGSTLATAVSRGRRFRLPDRRKGRGSAQPCSGRRS